MNFIEVLNNWEIKYDIFNIATVDGFDFYSYMHREFTKMTLDLVQGVKRDHLGEENKESQLKVFLRLLKKSEKISKKNVDLLVLNHSRRKLVDGKYVCQFTEFLSDYFPDSVYLERPHTNHTHLEPAVTKNLVYVDRIYLKSYIYRLLCKTLAPKKYKAIYAQIKAIMDEPFDALSKELGVEINKKKYYERCTLLYYFYKSRRKDYKKFLEKLNPKAVLEVVGGSIDARIINELCKEFEIPTIELQHCLLDVTAHYPKGHGTRQFTDYYLTYSDYWKEYSHFPIADERVIPCGSVEFESQVTKYLELKTTSDKKRIVFLSGPGYGEILSEVAVKLQELDKDNNLSIVYKLHPAEFNTWKDDYKVLAKSGIKVIDTREIGLYECFADADAQIGVYSTAIYEGIAFDLETYVLNIPFAGDFIDFCKAGHGLLVDDAKELYNALMNGDATKLNNSSDMFWKSNAKENVVVNIKNILNK